MGKGDIKTRKGKIANKSFGEKRRRKRRRGKSSIPKTKECVYCGTLLISKKKANKIKANTGTYPDNGETSDHVPQKCLFNGYSEKYKINIHTVPACHKCNLEFSKYEQDLRDLIGISNDNDKLQNNITESSVQNILSSKDCEQRLFRDNAGNVKGVGFDYNNLNISHEKNFKGLYYKKFNVRFPDNFKVYIIDLDRQKRIIELIKDNLEKNSSWQCSGHEDILKYRIEMVKQNNLGNYDKATKRNEADLILCQLVYHKNHDIVLLGVRDRLRRRQIN